MVTYSMKYFIANWKANKNIVTATEWINEFAQLINTNPTVFQKLNNHEIEIIICPPFPLIFPVKEMLKSFPNILLGSQDLSSFEDGTFTGEVTGNNLNNLVRYSIIGHSERKKNNHESLETDLKKVINAKKYNIEPIFCVADTSISIPDDINFVCLEPPNAISKGDGRGNYLSAISIVHDKALMNLPKTTKFIYGGSVNEDNVQEYLESIEIDGFLSGGASLDAKHFFKIISLA